MTALTRQMMLMSTYSGLANAIALDLEVILLDCVGHKRWLRAWSNVLAVCHNHASDSIRFPFDPIESSSDDALGSLGSTASFRIKRIS